ncbi:alpha/beta-hydrolase, partial [Aureobasidium melanogenum]
NNARRVRTVRTDLPTSTIALSSTGGLLAAAYEGGVEVFSLAPSALITDRRAVRAPKMDKLVFSQDDSILLGTTTRIFASSTLVVSVPIFPYNSSSQPSHQELQEAWCTGMLEPQNIKNSSHATFMREEGVMTNDKLFAWNGLEDTFGVLHTHDMVYNQVDFPVAISPPLSTCGGLGAAIHHCPSIDEHGKIVAMIVNDRTIRLYIVPQEAGDATTKVEAHSIDHELDEEYGCPFTDLRWVHSRLNLPASAHSPHQIRGRLVVTSPGSSVDAEKAELSVQDIEGGRIILFDFDPQFAGQPGQTFVFNVGKAPPVTLEEEKMEVADEIALVRRRTVTSSRSNTLGKKTPSLGRAATTISRRQDHSAYRDGSPVGSTQQLSLSNPPWRNRRISSSLVSLSADATRSLPDLLEASELAAESLEQPYSQGAPRSYVSIERAATAANAHRFQALEEHEAESDHPGDLMLPAYTEHPNQPLPRKYRALAGLDIPSQESFARQNNNPSSTIHTAPPTVPEHRFPAPTSTMSPAYAMPQFATYNQPPSPMRAVINSSYSDNSDLSPVTTRSGTHATLRTQQSWETISTSAQTTPHGPSTLRSQPSWESGRTMNHFSSNNSQGTRTVPTSPEHMRPPQMMQGLGLQDFRHSMLLPQDRHEQERPRTTASDSQVREEASNIIQHRPPHVNAMQAVNFAAANTLTPTNTSASRTSAGAVSAVSTVSSNGTLPHRPATSAAAVGYQVTSWSPPAPPSPHENTRPTLTSRSKSAGFPSSRNGARAASSSIALNRVGVDRDEEAQIKRSKSVALCTSKSYLNADMMSSRFFILAFLSAGMCVANGHQQHPKLTSPYCGLDVTYKKSCICETTPGVNSFSGYVHLPSSLLMDTQDPSDPYNISTFFWYFESRNNPRAAPLTIWLAGGPGDASSFAAVTENGPCYVNEFSNGTVLNPYSLNQHSNVLYIDQPVQAGFSYSTFMNSTFNFNNLNPYASSITPIDSYDGDVPPENATFKYGIWADQNPDRTANTTENAMKPLWHFLQGWVENFPEYKTRDRRVNIWGNSYGGFWTTGLTSYILDQNARIRNRTIPGRVINVNTLGMTNGCVDAHITATSIGDIVYNNTYNTHFLPEEIHAEAQNNLTKSDGCYDQIDQCQALAAEYDPNGKGNNNTVNDICATAVAYCFAYGGSGAYTALSGRSVFDMAQTSLAPYPPYYGIGYLNRQDVREELGVPVMFSQNSASVQNNFVAITGDAARFNGMRALNQILTAGVKAAFVFGDRDTRCNWLNGEAVANTAAWPGKQQFSAAGYEDTKINATYTGGLTKQSQNLSFTRVFQAGHAAGYFQPQTVLEIFERSSVWDSDVATGIRRLAANGNYSTSGPASAWSHFEVLPDVPTPVCDIWAAAVACTDEQLAALANGSAVIEHDIVVYPTATLFGTVPTSYGVER